jgi:RHS repeat-associated protein
MPNSGSFLVAKAARRSLLLSTLIALAGCGRPEATAPAPPEPPVSRLTEPLVVAPEALLVVGSTTLQPGDQRTRDRLANTLGFSVTLKAAVSAQTGDASGKALVVISESAAATDVGAKFKTVTQPVLVLQWGSFTNMALTGTSSTNFGTRTGQTQVAISSSSHALAAGLSGTQTVTTSAQTFGWGQPAGGAESVATIVGNSSQVVIFGYQTGVTMAQSFTAPGRRVGWFGSQAAINAFPAAGTGPGWALFDAAVRWVTRTEALMLTNSATLTAGESAIRNRLTSQLAMAVRVVAITSQNQSTIASQVSPAGLVIVSDSLPTSTAGTVATSLVNVATPILSFQAAAFGNLQLTGGTSGTDWGTTTGQSRLDIVKAAHPLAAGLSGSGTSAPVVVTSGQSAQTFHWGATFGTGVVKVANISGNASRVAVFGYPKNSLRRNGTAAPARRVGFYGSAATFANSVPNANAWALFDASVTWATNRDFDPTCEAAGDGAGCSDSNACTSESCQNQRCAIANLPAGTGCSDGNACNGTETCSGSGVCQGGTALNCDDFDPCTADSCAGAGGCQHSGRDPACAATQVSLKINHLQYGGDICVTGVSCSSMMTVTPGTYVITGPIGPDGTTTLGRLTVKPNGSVEPLDNLETYFTVDRANATLTAILVPVRFALNGYLGQIDLRGVGSATPAPNRDTIWVLPGRKYDLATSYAQALRGDPASGDHFSRVPYGLTVSTTGSISLDNDSKRFFEGWQDGNSLLTLKTRTVIFDLNRYMGELGFNQIATVNSGRTSITLLAARRYAVLSPSANALPTDSSAPGGDWLAGGDHAGFWLDENKNIGMDGDTKRFFLNWQDGNAVPVLNTMAIRYVFNGFAGRIAIFQLSDASLATTDSIYVLPGRQYCVQTPYLGNLDNDMNWFPYNCGTAKVGFDKSVTLESPLTEYLRQATPGASVLEARTMTLTFDFQGHLAPVDLWETATMTNALPSVSLLVNRRYGLQSRYAYRPEVPSDNAFFSAAPNSLKITQSGQETPVVSFTDAADPLGTGSHAAVVGTTLRAKISHVKVSAPGFSGRICVDGYKCGPNGGALDVDLMQNRRYLVQNAGYITVRADATCPAPGITIGGVPIQVSCTDLNLVTVDVKRDMGFTSAAVEAGTWVDLYQGSSWITRAATDAAGQATFILPGAGPYRFRTEWWDSQWWSSATDDCSPTSCPNKTIAVSGVAVTATRPNNLPAPPWVSVNAYTGGPPWSTWAGVALTDANGVARVGIPAGTYRFQLQDLQRSYWSTADCTVPGCTTATISMDPCAGNSIGLCAVTPAATCRIGGSGSNFTVVFGYTNGAKNFYAAPGSDNRLEGGTATNQPGWFKANGNKTAFIVKSTGAEIKWWVNERLATSTGAPACNVTQSPDGTAIVVEGKTVVVEYDATAIASSSIDRTGEASGGSAAGDTTGALDITADGAASYAIPIKVPAGKNGVQPRLALSYSSRSGNDLLGVGWTLSGLPEITRCNRRLRGDGENVGPKFQDDLDAVCLDGQRLVEVSGSSECGNGLTCREFRTERDSGARILSHGTGGAFVWFEVRLRNGHVQKFGHFQGYDQPGSDSVGWANRHKLTWVPSTSSYVDSWSPQLVSWPLTEERDPYGNSFQVAYTVDSGPTGTASIEGLRGFEQVPSFIVYGGNSAQPRKVAFDYEDRPNDRDWSENFAGGIRYRVTKRLKAIKLWAPAPSISSLVRSYKLDYLPSETSSRSLLTAVRECDEEASPVVCMPPVQFTYDRGDKEFAQSFRRINTGLTGPLKPGTYGASNIDIADVDGDGRDDVLYEFEGNGITPQYMASRSNAPSTWLPGGSAAEQTDPLKPEVATGFKAQAHSFGEDLRYWTYPRAIDMDGDGKVELYLGGKFMKFDLATNSFQNIHNVPGRGGVTSSGAIVTPEAVVPDEHIVIGDFNGDGLVEYMVPHIWHFEDDSCLTSWSVRPGVPGGAFAADWVDLSGLWSFEMYREPTLLPGQDSGCFQKMNNDPPYRADSVTLFGGVGDGRQAVMRRSGAGTAGAFTFKGTTAITAEWAGTVGGGVTKTNGPFRTRDLNGDGLPELIEGSNIYVNTGNGFFGPVPTTLLDTTVVLDFNGDGRNDFLHPESRLSAQTPEMVISITGGAKQTVATVSSGIIRGLPATGDEGSRYEFQCSTGATFDVFSCMRDQPFAACMDSWVTDQYRVHQQTCTRGPVIRPIDDNARYNTTRVLDWNGDGLSDIAQMEPGPMEGAPALAIYVRNGSKPDLLKTVSTGLGAKTTINYKPLIDSSVYTPAESCTYPLKCVKNGMWVVSEVQYDQGLSSFSHSDVQYSYRDGRLDLKGGGFLGFAQRTETRSVLPSAANGNVRFTQTSNVFHEMAFQTISYGQSSADDSSLDQYPFARYPTKIETTIANTTFWTGGLHRGTRRTLTPNLQRGVAEGYPAQPNQRIFRVDTVGEATIEYENTLADPLSGLPADFKRGKFVQRTFDTYGNVTHERVDHSWRFKHSDTGNESAYTETTTTFEGVAQGTLSKKRFFGLPEQTSTSAGYRGTTSSPQVVQFLYENGEADVSHAVYSGKTTQPGGGLDLESTVRTKRNADGLPFEVSVSDTAGETRTTTYLYDSFEGMYPVRITNPAGHVGQQIFNPAVDGRVWEQDPNGIVTKTYYDGFGRIRKTMGPGAVVNTVSYAFGSATEPYIVTTTSLGGAARRQMIHDRLGRQVGVKKSDFDGNWVTSKTVFNEMGLVSSVTRPYGQSSYLYDDFGRVRQEDRDDEAGQPRQDGPSRASVLTSYEDYFQTTITNEVGNTVVTVSDGLAQVRTRNEKLNGRALSTTYDYQPFGLIGRVTRPEGLTDFTYDVLGRQRTVKLPGTGVTTADYNAFGELRRQQDAAGRVTLFEDFDELGRPSTRRDSLNGQDLRTSFVYDSGAFGLGKMGQATSPEQISTSFSYDEQFGATRETTLTLPGQTGEQSFVTTNTFDSQGRIDQIQYPVTPGGQPRFAVKHSYRALSGQLESVANASNPNAVYWRATGRDAYGRILNEEFDSSTVFSAREYQELSGRLRSIVTNRGSDYLQSLLYDFRADGSLSNRRDGVSQLYEGFQYDDLDRLTRWYATDSQKNDISSTSWNVTWEHDDNGNLTKRTTTSTLGNQALVNRYEGTGNAGPHAVTSSSLWSGTFAYDRVGNVTSHPGLGTITYTAHNLPWRIEGGPAGTVTYHYDAFGGRVEKDGAGQTIYVGDLYERRASGGGVDHIFHVSSPERVIAQVRRHEGGTTDEVTYLYGDHVGSADGAETGGTARPTKFDPFGNRITFTADGRPDVRVVSGAMSGGAPGVTRGFTGHEMEDELGLINMGGRIYDPRVGRFLQPDPLVGAPGNSQGWNRYMYGLGNPLRYIDPSGLDSETLEQKAAEAELTLQQFCERDPQACKEMYFQVYTEKENGLAWLEQAKAFLPLDVDAEQAQAELLRDYLGGVSTIRPLTAVEGATVAKDLETAKGKVERTIKGLERWNEDDKKQFAKWFGTRKPDEQEAARQQVLKGFTAMKAHLANLSAENFIVDKTLGPQGFVAEVLGYNPYCISLAEGYFNELRHGYLDRADILIHELSHFWAVASTNASTPEVYRRQAAEDLAKKSPDKAIQNAQSWEFFASGY